MALKDHLKVKLLYSLKHVYVLQLRSRTSPHISTVLTRLKMSVPQEAYFFVVVSLTEMKAVHPEKQLFRGRCSAQRVSAVRSRL